MLSLLTEFYVKLTLGHQKEADISMLIHNTPCMQKE